MFLMFGKPNVNQFLVLGLFFKTSRKWQIAAACCEQLLLGMVVDGPLQSRFSNKINHLYSHASVILLQDG